MKIDIEMFVTHGTLRVTHGLLKKKLISHPGILSETYLSIIPGLLPEILDLYHGILLITQWSRMRAAPLVH